MKRKVAWAGAGLVVYAGAAWGVYQYLRPSGSECASTTCATTNGVPEGVWEGLAGGYDAAVDRDERVTGVLKRRAALLSSHARGHVLEIACGTGRNLLLYPMTPEVVRVTATDASPAMLDVARTKLLEQDGKARILLLEHGRPERHAWLAKYIDRRAPRHAHKWGCWWNRDISKLAEEAGLVVHEKTTYHLGTGYIIIASPPPQ
ncbi:ubiquinone/menaquinone biosynthesis-related protein [Acanthamoeba castellanii str. Neff]|uniref:Ubiquinone/menaquinone biosynthesis-related protein n=1 Tax=Acanthamoeba castellanii (strain ATCC 30010 / Neff) TaxID=1257118 RepID=L8HHT9_ACACF|nr:ubiquinone/menaquinone biosynthesis-related protein [Acanthamoeba castellanii str. Neff]ELR24777.1 ubiquinone/menaquinone biosynthesis-related protein [Acanthamoeba castellanii str. Neff]